MKDTLFDREGKEIFGGMGTADKMREMGKGRITVRGVRKGRTKENRKVAGGRGGGKGSQASRAVG